MSISKAIEILKNAEALIIYSGAGMSHPSGLSTFRGKSGFYELPVKGKSYTFESLVNPYSLQEEPEIVLGFYGRRLNNYKETTPHSGYSKLLEYANSLKYGYFSVTTNIDGHFEKAGFSPSQIHEPHGSIHHFQCSSQHCASKNGLINPPVIEIDENNMATNIDSLKCAHCGKLLRPNVMMFNDYDFSHKKERVQASRYNAFIQDLYEKNIKVAILEIGAGNAIPTMRIESAREAKRFSTNVIRINVEPDNDYSVLLIAEDAKTALSRILPN
ncbi:SIR2 family NAD-dependent protein deacylase [Photobacterium kishitanii]|uniref:protein acetyllysine N-acetyltransferase n=1 Tax=Photobacterium kishitanii TaxID=318456 RepID=A0A2T3KLP7_9GAMM|nr:Sir2 family NAD-dependent protein deacetylase [Photobacterium kishitanii]PSV00596.1 NAD-dependent deacetylase [Photobacterium kishitanii]